MTYVDKIFGGWADAYRVAKCSVHNGRNVLTNSHGETLDLWEGLSCWWVEEHELAPERDTAKSLEDLFGNSEPSAHVDTGSLIFNTRTNQLSSVSVGGSLVTGTVAPSTQLNISTTAQITGINAEGWFDALKHPVMKITTPKSTGRWEWEKIVVETTSPPHPIRKTLISLLTGAKWIPYLPKHETKYYGYLRLMPNPAHLTQSLPSTN